MFKTVLFTFLALLAFAGNSVLCRLALNDEAIDATSFTSIRLLSGALFLVFLLVINTKKTINIQNGNWSSAVFLFLYALTFSFAYITLDTGIGALILFGTVQITMILIGLIRGNKLLVIEWFGLSIAFIGLVILLLPGASAPSLTGFVLMVVSGIAWGLYTLAGKGSKTPLLDTVNNFVRTIPFVIVFLVFMMLVSLDKFQLSQQGILLAILSGAITSGLGYAIWYSALPRLNVTQAAILQLSVPIIAAFGGVVFSQEVITTHLSFSSLLVLGGVLLVILGKKYSLKKVQK